MPTPNPPPRPVGAPTDNLAYARAETSLVERDVGLPGLEALLDPDLLAPLLAKAWPDRCITDLTPTYLRYKPGVNCLAAFCATVDGHPEHLAAVTYTATDADKLRKVAERKVRHPRLTPTVVAPGVAVRALPDDRGLRQLYRYSDPGKRARRLARVPDTPPGLSAGHLSVLRYKPERRLVGSLEGDRGERALVKLVSARAFPAVLRGARFATTLPLSAPLLSVYAQDGLALWRWLEGEPCDTHLRHAPQDAYAVGEALATLHAQAPGELQALDPEKRATAFKELGEFIAFILPEQARVARELAASLVRCGAQLDASLTPVHGDFSADQALMTPEGVRLIDFDNACLAHPAWDVASFSAALEMQRLRGDLSAEAYVSALDAFYRGYLDRSGRVIRDLPLYLATCLFKLTPHPFRTRRAAWPAETQALLARVQELVASP